MTNQTPNNTAREQTNWAKPAGPLHTGAVDAGAINLNVEGRTLTGPLKGFGQMWQKTYSVRLSGASSSTMPASSPARWRCSTWPPPAGRPSP